MSDAKADFDDLFPPDKEEKFNDAPQSPDAALLDAVLIFYRELGLRRTTIEHVAAQSMSRHKKAMRRALAHVLAGHVDERKLLAILGPTAPGVI
jgi:hypothetical protein